MPAENLKTIENPKVPAKRGRKPSVKAATVISDKPKRTYNKKQVKKVNLPVRNISSDKEPVDTIAKPRNKEKMIIKGNDLKMPSVKKDIKNNKDKAAVAPKVVPEIPKARIIKERTEADKKKIMWIGVSFFMVLIIIFWVYSTKESIENFKSEWKPSEKAQTWNQMSDEIGRQIDEIKKGVDTLQNLGTSTDKDIQENQSTDGSSTKNLDQTVIDDLKKDLESKQVSQETDGSSYYYEMNDSEKAQLIASLDKLKIQVTTLNEVRALLGEADFSEELKDKRGVFVAYILSYYTKIYKQNESNEQFDRYVSLEFDQAGKLTKVNRNLD